MRTRVGFFEDGSMSITFETWIAFSNCTFWPGVVPCFFTCFVTILTPSTITICSFGNARRTFASTGVRFSTPSIFFSTRKRFFPAMIRTMSQVWIFIIIVLIQLDNFWSLTDNSLETFVTSEFSEYWTENTSSLWFTFVIDDNTCVVIRTNS